MRRQIDTVSPKEWGKQAPKNWCRRLGLLVLCTLLLLSAVACKKKEKPKSPDAYAIGTDVAPTLDSLLTADGEGELTAITPLDEAGAPLEVPKETPAPESTEAPTPVEPSQYVYTYEKLTAGGTTAQAYAALLATEENGFITVGEDGKPIDPPDYTAETGMAILVKEGSTEGTLLQIRLDWTAKDCKVTVSNPEGTLKAEVQSMTVNEAIDFFEGLHPAALGLAGTSMRNYEIYPREGLVMADGNACIQMAVYHKTEQGTNAVDGIYLVTGDKAHIYRLDKQKKSITELMISSA